MKIANKHRTFIGGSIAFMLIDTKCSLLGENYCYCMSEGKKTGCASVFYGWQPFYFIHCKSI